MARARSAPRELTRRSCPSVVSAANAASSATGPRARAPQGTWPAGPRKSRSEAPTGARPRLCVLRRSHAQQPSTVFQMKRTPPGTQPTCNPRSQRCLLGNEPNEIDAMAPSIPTRRPHLTASRLALSIAVIAMVAGGYLTWQAPAQATAPAAAPPAIPVSVAAVLERQVAQWDEFSGRLEAVGGVDVRSRVAGTIDSIHFSPGALVNKGDTLIVIDPKPFAAEVARAEAARRRGTGAARVDWLGAVACQGAARGSRRLAARIRRAQQRAARSTGHVAGRAGGARGRATQPRLHAHHGADRRPRQPCRSHGRQSRRGRRRRAGADVDRLGVADLCDLRSR